MTYTPQPNGVAERRNKTLLDTTRVMLRTACIAKLFWTKAVKTVCYILNRSPSVAIDPKTSMDMWTVKPTNYYHLHIFRIHVYVLYNE